jgi:hypothetical protein
VQAAEVGLAAAAGLLLLLSASAGWVVHRRRRRRRVAEQEARYDALLASGERVSGVHGDAHGDAAFGAVPLAPPRDVRAQLQGMGYRQLG